jgi:hypothetical protein
MKLQSIIAASLLSACSLKQSVPIEITEPKHSVYRAGDSTAAVTVLARSPVVECLTPYVFKVDGPRRTLVGEIHDEKQRIGDSLYSAWCLAPGEPLPRESAAGAVYHLAPGSYVFRIEAKNHGIVVGARERPFTVR